MINNSFEDRSGDLLAISQGIKDDIFASLQSCLPGIIRSFNPITQTAEVFVAIKRRVKHDDGVKEDADPILPDVPVVFLGGGGSSLTFPVRAGDECLVFFSDRCIDAWYQSGGVQNQIVPRFHDLSDGFALVGIRSKPNVIKDFNQEKPSVVGGLVVDGEDVGKAGWENVKDKPSVYPPNAHEHFILGSIYSSCINVPPKTLYGHYWKALTPETTFGVMVYAWCYTKEGG